MLRIEAQRGKALELELAYLYHERGMTLAEVARELGVNVSTISRWMAALGIEARFPGQRGRPSGVAA
jgi:transposase-like protein